MRNTALIFALFATTAASAQTYPRDEITVSGLTHHVHARADGKKWNEQVVQAVGVRRAWSPAWAASTDLGVDSRYRLSAYASADWTPFGTQQFRFGGFAGVRLTKDGVRGQAGLTGRYQTEKWSISLRVWPTVGNASGGRVLQIGRVF